MVLVFLPSLFKKNIIPVLLCAGICLFASPLLSAPSKSTQKQTTHLHLSLQQAIERALTSNRLLTDSLYTMQGQQITLSTDKSEFDYKYFPVAEAGVNRDGETIGYGFSVRKKFTGGPRAVITPRYASQGSRYRGQLSLSLTIPLLKGRGRETTLDTVHSSEYQLQRAEYSHRSAQEQVVIDTITAVYTIINKRELELIFSNSIQKLQKEVEYARIKAKVGLAGPLDIYRAEIEVKEAEDSQVSAQSELKRAKDRLKVLLSLPLVTKISVSAPEVVEKVDITLEDAIDIALKNKIELQQIKRDLIDIERRIRVARNNVLPQADINFRYDKSNIDLFDSQEDKERAYWSVRLVSETDLARKREKSTLALRLLELKRKRLSAQTAKEQVKEDIGNQFTELSQAQKRLTIRKKQIGQAGRKLTRATIKFKHGMADNFEVIASETALQHARINLLNVETEYILGTYRLRKQIGTLLEFF